MTGSTPSVLAIRYSLIISLLSSTVFFLVVNREEPYNYFFTALFFGFMFISSFLTLRYTLMKFVQEKLSSIYNTIHQLKKDPKKKIQSLSTEDAIKEVQEDVVDWYLDNKKEVDRLNVLETYRREFIGNVSHELKTPVFNIQGYLLTLLEGGLEDETINRKFLERAEKSVEKLIKLLNELDMIIRLDTGGIKLNFQTVDIVAIVKEAIEALEFKAEKKGIQFEINRKFLDPIWIKADEDKIGQVVSNLLLNSIKYGVNGGKTKISFQDMNDKILIEFKDNGIGIKEKELSRVFDRFYRTEKGRSYDSKGFGLGLSIVKHIVEAHNETIQLNSQEGKGSTFSFTLSKSNR